MKTGKMKSLAQKSVLLLIASMGLIACESDDLVDSSSTPAVLVTPNDFPAMVIPSDNKPTEERIALGRRLYNDPMLGDGSQACSSCHVKANGFTSDGSGVGRPVLPHVNMAWKSQFMWDGSKTGTLEDVMLFEVEQFFQTDVSLFNNDPEYVSLFEVAFGAGPITSEKMAKALAQYARTQTSYSSKYDRVMAGRESFTAEEQAGYTLFMSEAGSCTHCHTPPLFTDDNLHNIGLDSVFSNSENHGYYAISGDSIDLGRMRTATLRNVGLRTRFMHDGRFQTLEEVVNHYNTGVQKTRSLDPMMIKKDGSTTLKLTPQQVSEIAAFLNTLTDTVFCSP